ncbi:DUF3467 domain-containing protein [Candidatus Uabimicrobium amorphum]|uniref:DUF3467 domain-containing protein n=1 Tax=Uabimicrobium amorphum TaxID=2596890 RepID=A0A5S9INS4_UABAM|nr:DUF3467 domain-containing protein [Candidatus Uabimicrobium amorphum]BBM85279.1 hypothetical protein UABAM_03643 [Candidatus Uabimicrobium amorphum]
MSEQKSRKKITVRPSQKKQTSAPVKLSFESTDVSYCSQFSVQATTQEVFLNFAASLFPGTNPGEIVLPVHTRVAMNYVNAKRLLAVLAETVQKYENEYGEIKDVVKSELPKDKGNSMSSTTASFPKINR